MKNANDSEQRSGCPINLTLEVVGDKWSLLVIRDMIFGNRRHFRELLTKSEEGIASNILADRLKRLVEQGIVSRADDPTHKQKGIYSLTEKGHRAAAGARADGGVGAQISARSPRSSRSARNCWKKAGRSSGPSSWRSCARRTSA